MKLDIAEKFIHPDEDALRKTVDQNEIKKRRVENLFKWVNRVNAGKEEKEAKLTQERLELIQKIVK